MTRKFGLGAIVTAAIVLVAVLWLSVMFLFDGDWRFPSVDHGEQLRSAERSPGPKAPLAESKSGAAQGPQHTVQTFGDWSVRCDIRYGNSPQKICDLAQLFSAKGGGAPPVAQLMIERHNKKEPMRMVLQLQANAFMTPGVNFVYDDKQPALSLAFSRCFPNACFASGPLAEDIARGLRSQTGAARIEFKDGSERDVAVPVSLNGFATAFDVWLKEGS